MNRTGPDPLKAALIQHRCHYDAARNLERACQSIRQAAAQGTRLVLLQELFLTPYFCQSEEPRWFDLAEPIPGPTTDRLGRLAAELELVIVAPLFERRAAGLYHNSAAVLDADGRLAGVYRKMHIPDDPGFYEKFYFTPGDGDFRPIATRAGRLGVLICWDQWFPEAARLMALAGAEILLYPTAIGWDASEDRQERQRQFEAWMTVQRGHAIANALPLLCCNRCGHEAGPHGPHGQGLHFWGSSFACGPQGELLAQAPADEEQVLLVELDLARTETVRRIWPFFRDRRPEAYADLLKRWRAGAGDGSR